MSLFSTNPILFKIKYLNRDKIDTTTNISAIIGRAFHRAMEVYYSPEAPKDEGEAIALALKEGLLFMEQFPEGWINWSKTIETRQKALEIVAFAIREYVKIAQRDAEETVSCEECLLSNIDIEWRGERLSLPVTLKGYTDRITRGKDGKLRIRDYKTCASFSDGDKIDGAKILQAVTYYLLAYARYGEPPHSFLFEEVKTSTNRDGSPQVREYEIVFEEHELYFEFFFRFYADMVRALNGEMVYVPNIRTLFDNEVSIVAYIQRLDVSEEAAALMKKHEVTTLTDLLKKEIATAANMRKLLEGAAEKLVQVKSINYASMEHHEKIQAKLLELGVVIKYHSLIEGASVNLYRFTTGIGVTMSRIRQYADDVQMVLGTQGVRVIAPIPGTTFIGFEVPRADRRFPALPESQGLNLAIGEMVDGSVRRFDLREAPHMLVAGSTGSGKSIFLHDIILQLRGRSDIELHLIDPKRVEFTLHKTFACEYLSDVSEITRSLFDLAEEMDRRYDVIERAGVRDISKMDGMPYKVVVIDEYADLAMQRVKVPKAISAKPMKMTEGEIPTEGTAEIEFYPSIEESLQRIAQKGRAAGIHVILATQRASTRIITGDIKVNFPVKAVFRMAKGIDSRVMLDEEGAEKLLGKGDMLFQSDAGTERLQGYNPNV